MLFVYHFKNASENSKSSGHELFLGWLTVGYYILNGNLSRITYLPTGSSEYYLIFV